MPKLATRGVELEPIDRLEEKVKLLVGMVDRMKAEQARAAEENQRLSAEHEAMRARVAATEAMAADMAALRSERDAIRTRVTDMLEQLEALNL
jgi:regulator of replication initiation timing